MGRGPGRAALAATRLAEARPPAVVSTDPPHRPVTHLVAGDTDLIGEEPIAELGIVPVGVADGVRYIRLVELGCGDRVGQPPVVGLTSDLEDPARHRDGDPVIGKLTAARGHNFPRSFAWAT